VELTTEEIDDQENVSGGDDGVTAVALTGSAVASNMGFKLNYTLAAGCGLRRRPSRFPTTGRLA
jgi:hypothetical protein